MINRLTRVAMTALSLLLGSSAAVWGDDLPAKRPADALPEVASSPNPFVFLDGSSVKAVEECGRRREELKELFQAYEYGHLPPKPRSMTVTRGEVGAGTVARSLEQNHEAVFEHDGRSLPLHFRLTWPRDPTGRLPVVIRSSSFQNERPGDGRTHRSADAGVPIDRGYAVAAFDLGKPLPDEFNKLPYPEEPNGFAWDAPTTAPAASSAP